MNLFFSLVVLTAGDTRLTFAPNPVRISLERGAAVPVPHPIGGVLLGDPDRPEPASVTLPVDHTPLFVGGSGIVIEKRERRLVARIYPVSARAELRFIHPDGLFISTIRVNAAIWKQVSVRCSADSSCAGFWRRHAFEFGIRPGADYEIC